MTRSHSEPRATQDADAIAARALALLEKTEAGRRPVRLLGRERAQPAGDRGDGTEAVIGTPELPFEGD